MKSSERERPLRCGPGTASPARSGVVRDAGSHTTKAAPPDERFSAEIRPQTFRKYALGLLAEGQGLRLPRKVLHRHRPRLPTVAAASRPACTWRRSRAD